MSRRPKDTYIVNSGDFSWEGSAASPEDALALSASTITPEHHLGFAVRVKVKDRRGSSAWMYSEYWRTMRVAVMDQR